MLCVAGRDVGAQRIAERDGENGQSNQEGGG